uniref:Hemagglutinin protein n=1 Tax=Neotermes castaneus orthomyxovirus 1 TaxID=3133494 RepID=A0AAT9J9Q8_9ORTO
MSPIIQGVIISGLLMIVRGLQTCSSENCVGPYEINIPKMPTVNITWNEHKAELTIAQEQILVGTYIRESYYAYCYEGGPGDSNTGCEKKRTPSPPNRDEAKEWEKRNQCQIGDTCYSCHCWGDTANNRYANRNKLTKWVKSKEGFTHFNEECYSFPYHTFISEWRCTQHHAEFPISLVYTKSTNGWTRMIAGPKGDLIPLKDMLSDKGRVVDDATRMYVSPDQIVDMVVQTVTIKCFGSQLSEESLCQLPDGIGQMSNSIMKVTWNSSISSDRNIGLKVFYIENSAPTIRSASKRNKREVNDNLRLSDVGQNLYEAASVNDLKPIVNAIIYSSNEAHYNLMQTLNMIDRIHRILKEVITSISKVDDELIGNILNNPSKSKWFNRNIFHLCPCFRPAFNSSSNCAGPFIFRQGRIQEKGENDICTQYQDGSTTPLIIFKQGTFSVGVLDIPPAQGASATWEGWSWIAERQSDLLNSVAFAVRSTSGSSPLQWLSLESINPFVFWTYLSRYSSIIAWIALGLHFIRR